MTELITEEGDQADLTPLIDCVFLLLLFFIVTSTFSEQTFFQVELPSAQNAQVATVTDAFVVHVSEQGTFAVNDQLVNEGDLGRFIDAWHQRSPIQLFVINGDRRAPYEKVTLAFDIAQGLGVEQVSFTVER